ncbi:MAG: FlgD immunoglobulin-like domain containing protein [Candidatus Eisenbacteria bacterium]
MTRSALCFARQWPVPLLLSIAPASPRAADEPAPAPIRAPSYTIYEIQVSDAAHNWESPHLGEVVACPGGIVTHKYRQRFTLRDPDLGDEWAAIEVRGYPVYPTGIEIGDQVDFDNVYVDEYRGETVLQYYSASSHTINSHGNPLPEPVALTLWDVRYPAHPEDCERYSGMHVAIDEQIRIGARDLGAHGDNYELAGASDTAWASDYANTDIDSTYCVATGECYRRITGVLQRYCLEEQWDYYQILPTGLDDYEPCDSGVGDGPALPGIDLRLPAPHPNPFLHEARIPFVLARPARVRVEVFDATGRRVDLLFHGPKGAGAHELTWDGRTRLEERVLPGIYLVRVTAGARVLTRRLCFIE